jgi:type II secretory pathway pseudopilin PulG
MEMNMPRFPANQTGLQHRQRGFSLIEALFSALILGIALLGLAGFHAVALQDGSLVKARSVGANLAQQKLDDLRSFIRLRDDGNLLNGDECAAGTFCFSEIVASTADVNVGGGQENGNALLLPSGAVSGYTDNYSVAWTVTCSPDTAGAAVSFGTACTNAAAKLATVTTSWTDSKGANQSVTLQGVIYGLDPAKSALAAGSSFSTQIPKAGYTPIGVPDAVPVPISTGDGKFKESSKPLPDLSSKGYSLRTEFDSVGYTTAGGTTTKDSQLEFATVNCVCQFAGSGSAYPASYFYWNGSGVQIKAAGETVSKMTGTAPMINGDKQDELCTSCCRDHHDSEAPGTSSPTTALYDSDRPAADYAGNDHKHYYYADPGDPEDGLVEVAPSSGNRYLEACRFARVDGIQRLLQDWRALDMVVLPYKDYLNNQTKLVAYQNYLVDYLSYQVMLDCAASGASGCTSSTAPSKSSLATRDLSSQTEDTVNQFLARALYADRVYSKTAPRALDAGYYSALASRISSNSTWLDRLPFNEVNVTLLANWASSDPAVVSVTNEQILDIDATTQNYYGVYSRGLTKIKPGDGGSADVTAYLLPSNSGLTSGVKRAPISSAQDYDSSLVASGTISYAGPIGIDRDDHRSGNRLHDQVNIGRAVSSSTTVKSGNIRIGNASALLVDSTDVTMSASPPATCTVAGPVNGVTSYTCSISNSYAGTLTIASSATGAFFDVGGDTSYDTEKYNAVSGTVPVPENSCTVTAGTINPACPNFWVFGPIANVLGKCFGEECATSTFASKLNGTDADVACTLNGTDVTCPVTLDPATKTWTGKVKITSGNGSYVSASSTCDSNDGTAAKLTSSINAGPEDKQQAFDVCATKVAAITPPPATPTGLNLFANANFFALTWNDVANETGYVVYRCDVSGNNVCAPSNAVSYPGANITYVALTRANKGQTSCVNIKATNAGGYSAASQTVCLYRP